MILYLADIPTSELIEESHQKKIEYFGNSITYSPKVFIPLTTMCRDKCAYCTFVKSPMMVVNTYQ
jgi:FO synthase